MLRQHHWALRRDGRTWKDGFRQMHQGGYHPDRNPAGKGLEGCILLALGVAYS
jgi:hypothetical protein